MNFIRFVNRSALSRQDSKTAGASESAYPDSARRHFRLGLCALIIVFAGAIFSSDVAKAEESATSTPVTRETADGSEPKKTLTEFGETYVLSSSARSDAADTEEYILEGQTAGDWSRAIVYQRIGFSTPVAPDAFVGSLRRRIGDETPGSQFRVVLQGKSASIFAVHYARTAGEPEQVAIALAAVADPKRPNELHLIQFALRPDRLDLPTMERLVKRWQTRFQSQAASLNR